MTGYAFKVDFDKAGYKKCIVLIVFIKIYIYNNKKQLYYNLVSEKRKKREKIASDLYSTSNEFIIYPSSLRLPHNSLLPIICFFPLNKSSIHFFLFSRIYNNP